MNGYAKENVDLFPSATQEETVDFHRRSVEAYSSYKDSLRNGTGESPRDDFFERRPMQDDLFTQGIVLLLPSENLHSAFRRDSQSEDNLECVVRNEGPRYRQDCNRH